MEDKEKMSSSLKGGHMNEFKKAELQGIEPKYNGEGTFVVGS